MAVRMRLRTDLMFYAVYYTDTYMQKCKKNYVDSRSRRNLSTINTELQDVQRIMVQNIDDVLMRGEQLTSMYTTASPTEQSLCGVNVFSSVQADISQTVYYFFFLNFTYIFLALVAWIKPTFLKFEIKNGRPRAVFMPKFSQSE